ncbi:MAG: squalene--hopene cyclase [bacterium]|nr:squalene--hopene cyclase [bacterium]
MAGAEEPRDLDFAQGLEEAVTRAQGCLLERQAADGHWCAELEGDLILESEYILTMQYLGRADEARVHKAAEHLRRSQRSEGGWSLYPGGPADVSASVKAYFVLKILGDDPSSEPMSRARRAILEAGGLEACNSFTKLYLSVFGQYDWNRAPAVPPELVLLPKWFPFNLYEMSAWSRAIVVPLAIIWALKPAGEVPEGAGIGELRVDDTRHEHPAVSGLRGRLWGLVFVLIDRFIKFCQLIPFHPFRQLAINRAEAWILERLPESDGLAAIFPPIVNTIIALESLGYSQDDPVLASQIRELEKLEIEDGETLRVQPCKSPVWDTALAVSSLVGSGLAPDHPAFTRAGSWLADKEVRRPGDWRQKNPAGPVGGWFFEYSNENYPDCDDTAEVLKGLNGLRASGEVSLAVEGAMDRARDWLLSMQNRDGGWASFDKGCDREFLTFIPFADHNAMIDPSTTDITSRVIEALIGLGIDRGDPAIRRGVRFIRAEQEADGSWYGRWGCNYLYGTWLALVGLAAAGEDMSRPWARRAADWLRSKQNPDGGWGELPESYSNPALKGVGPSTASQTAWALMGLMAAGGANCAEARRGVDFLVSCQLEDGGWRDGAWTGTGFPKVFYLNYHGYALYFPLLALGEWRNRSRLVRELAEGRTRERVA